MSLWVMKMDPDITSWLAYSLLLRAARKLYPYYKMSFRPTVHTLPLANIHQDISWIDQNWNHAILVDHCPWQAQYPENLYYRTDILMKSVQAMSNLEDDIRSCPSRFAANKKERPKKNERIRQRSVRSSTTTLRIAGRIQQINRTLHRAVLMLEMVERVK
jgi:hypothetical protein